MTHLDTATSAGSHAAPRVRRHWIRRTIMLGIVLPGALVAWQQIATRPVAVEVTALEQLDATTSVGMLNRAIRNSSPTMVDFFDSPEFDQYARWYATHDATEVQLQDRYAEKCDRARGQVWLPPFYGSVRSDCDALRDASLDQRRGIAFGPILIEYVRRCASGEERPLRQENPYTDAQWRDLTTVIEKALDVDCDPHAMRDDENFQSV